MRGQISLCMCRCTTTTQRTHNISARIVPSLPRGPRAGREVARPRARIPAAAAAFCRTISPAAITTTAAAPHLLPFRVVAGGVGVALRAEGDGVTAAAALPEGFHLQRTISWTRHAVRRGVQWEAVASGAGNVSVRHEM